MDLNLFLHESEAPFRLARKGEDPSDRDDLFTPEDWAWEFLRLSSDYQDAYKAAKEQVPLSNGNIAGAFDATSKFSERIKTDEITCRSRFGLSTWLDPKKRLPGRPERGGSWFYPLSDCMNRPEDSVLPVTLPGLFGPRPLVPFAKTSRRNTKLDSGARRLVASPYVWFAIDCSVSPNAQIATATAISEIRLDWLHSRGALIQADSVVKKGEPVQLADCGRFDRNAFKTAGRPAEGIDPTELWFAVRVDVSKRIAEQMTHWKKELTSKNAQLLKAGKAVHFNPKRLRDPFAQNDDAGSILSDGDFLKQRAICAQLSLAGLNAEEIAEYVKEHATNRGMTNIVPRSRHDLWNKAFSVRLQRYIEDGLRLVNGDFRRLIHAQKP